jgi:hypothetical protein
VPGLTYSPFSAAISAKTEDRQWKLFGIERKNPSKRQWTKKATFSG